MLRRKQYQLLGEFLFFKDCTTNTKILYFLIQFRKIFFGDSKYPSQEPGLVTQLDFCLTSMKKRLAADVGWWYM